MMNAIITDYKKVMVLRDTKTGELSYSLAVPDKYIAYTKIAVLYYMKNINTLAVVVRKLSQKFIDRVYYNSDGTNRDPLECRGIWDDCSLRLAMEDAAFKYCYLGPITVEDMRI